MNRQWMTTRQAAEKWKVSLGYVQRLLAAGRVPCVKKYGRFWMIPAEAKKPGHLFQEKQREIASPLGCLSLMWEGFLPDMESERLLNPMERQSLQYLYESEIAYLHGDFDRAKHLAQKARDSDPACVGGFLFSIFAAISTNDFALYDQMEAALREREETSAGSQDAKLAGIVLATGAVCMFASEMVPLWLKEGNFSGLPQEAASFVLYFRVKYLQGIAAHSQMFHVAHTMLVMGKGKSAVRDIYLLLMCAVACVGIGQRDQGRNYVAKALSIGIPLGFITPFMENICTLTGLVEECVKRDYPHLFDLLIAQGKLTWKNWVIFHNRFARDHIPLILTLREYRIAVLAANRVPYAKIAKEENISVGRVRNILQDIYGKLFIHSRAELAAMVLWTPEKSDDSI